MSEFIHLRMARERTLLARKQIQLAMMTLVMISAMILVLLFNTLFS